ncbi:hypothetical protein AMECASPLE_003059 [Ameca splendens]|uniref:Uncharacterized protein n=1 Tax=Ameca splendens TaxID=208324 RepID=A0ABV0YWH0_9TELE
MKEDRPHKFKSSFEDCGTDGNREVVWVRKTTEEVSRQDVGWREGEDMQHRSQLEAKCLTMFLQHRSWTEVSEGPINGRLACKGLGIEFMMTWTFGHALYKKCLSALDALPGRREEKLFPVLKDGIWSRFCRHVGEHL